MTARGLLVVLDGWGHDQRDRANAVRAAATPVVDHALANLPATFLEAAGRAVGLTEGTPGNSEVGHITLGAGRVIDYESTRVSLAMEAGTLSGRPELVGFLRRVQARGAELHVILLASDGDIHSRIEHARPVLEAAAGLGLDAVRLHVFTDGRDTPDGSGLASVERVERLAESVGVGRLATVCGRAYSMDKNGNWPRTRAAFGAITSGIGVPVRHAADAVRAAYARGLSDQMVEPSVVVDSAGVPVATVRDGDGAFFVNFRGDRMHQLLRPFVEPGFDGFPLPAPLAVDVLTMTDYHLDPPVPAVFGHVSVEDTLPDVLDLYRVPALRVSESEKFPHVTFFLDGREQRGRRQDDSIEVPSPPDSDYRRTPGMSAAGVVAELIRAMDEQRYGLIVSNLVNADTLGHTGDLEATTAAVETVDHCLGLLLVAARRAGYWVAVCGDHGNAEMMIDPLTEAPHVGHTVNPVPFFVANSGHRGHLMPGGLADVAPTLLELLGLPQPAAMTGRSLLATAGIPGLSRAR